MARPQSKITSTLATSYRAFEATKKLNRDEATQILRELAPHLYFEKEGLTLRMTPTGGIQPQDIEAVRNLINVAEFLNSQGILSWFSAGYQVSINGDKYESHKDVSFTVSLSGSAKKDVDTMKLGIGESPNITPHEPRYVENSLGAAAAQRRG